MYYKVQLQFEIIMAEAVDSLHNTKIKTFEQKVLNKSICDIKFYDKLADYLLEYCHAEAKPNTLSLFSFLPLFVLSLVVKGPSTINFLLTILFLFTHQLLDIANKKQAYRLSKFTLATFYIDHIFDALSCTCIVLIISRLLELSAAESLTAVYFFGMLPFYTHHLAMYNNEYMTFYTVSPNSEGLAVTKLLFLISAFIPSFFQLEVIQGIFIYQIYISLAVLWLILFLIKDIRDVQMGKRVTDARAGTQQHIPLKNIFVIFMLGYLVLEVTSIESQIIEDSVAFFLGFSVLSLVFTHIIGQLVLAYGYNQAFKQITLPFLVTMGSIVIYYAILVFGLKGSESEVIISKIFLATILVCFLFCLLRETWKNIIHIGQVIES